MYLVFAFFILMSSEGPKKAQEQGASFGLDFEVI